MHGRERRDLFQTLGFKISKGNRSGRGNLLLLLLLLLTRYRARSREFAFWSMELSGKILHVVTGLGKAKEWVEKFAARSIVNHRCRSVE